MRGSRVESAMQMRPRPLDEQLNFDQPHIRIPTQSSRRGFSEQQISNELKPRVVPNAGAHRQYNAASNNDYNTQIFIQQVPNMAIPQLR